ncbi:hypothetical protein BGZ91_007425 [Linnemannia elongata]|nr:hypothetical protein BGZ91_007425 [Linnemannia elongata]
MMQTYVFTTKTSKFVKRDLLSIKKDDMLRITGDIVCHSYFINGNIVYAPSITPEAIKMHKGKGPIVEFADVAASSDLAHEVLKKIAGGGKTTVAHDADDFVEIPMDPVKETSEDEKNLQKGIRQSIMAMNLIGVNPKAEESSSTVPSMGSFFTRNTKSVSPSSGSDQEPATRRVSLASLFGGNNGQSAQQPPPAQTTEEKEQEQEEPLERKRTHLRFRQPLTSTNPPGKKKAVTGQSQQETQQPETPEPSIAPSEASTRVRQAAPSSKKKGKTKKA